MKYGDKKAEEWLKGRVWNECGNNPRIMRHESYRLPVTVLVGLSCNGHLALRPSEQIG